MLCRFPLSGRQSLAAGTLQNRLAKAGHGPPRGETSLCGGSVLFGAGVCCRDKALANFCRVCNNWRMQAV